MLSIVHDGSKHKVLDRFGLELSDTEVRKIALLILAERCCQPMAATAPAAQTHAQRVADMVSQDIAVGTFKAGQRLDESILASRYGVSRTPVREALMQLAAAGAVSRQPHKGCRVIASSPI